MMIHGDETERLFRVGITHVKQLYPTRTLFFLSEFFDRFKDDNKKMFLFTSALPKLTILNRYMPNILSAELVCGKRCHWAITLPIEQIEESVL